MTDSSERGHSERGGRSTRRVFLGGAAAVGATALGGGVVGGGAAVTTINSCTTITSSGTYRLGQSLSPSSVSGDGCIEIEADDVTLQGDGHTLDGSNVSNGDVRAVSVEQMRRNVTVENLAVRNWSTGIFFSAESGRVEDVTATDAGTGLSLWNAAGNAVVDVSVEDSTRGVVLSADGSVTETSRNALEHVTVAGNDTGFRFGSFAVDNEVAASEIRDNGVGVETVVRSYETTVTGSNVVGNADYGAFNRDLTEEEVEQQYPDEPIQGSDVLEATDNYWGSACGPSSADDPDAPFADPQTGASADGDGDAVSEGVVESGVSNVHFDPFATEAFPDAGRRT